jgi:hypothetical protein
LACAAGAVSVRPYVEYDVVRVGRIRHPFNALELIEPEGISDPPRSQCAAASPRTGRVESRVNAGRGFEWAREPFVIVAVGLGIVVPLIVALLIAWSI